MQAPLQAPIERVTLYRNGALVVRKGRAEPGAVVLEGLPLLYSSDSLRVRCPSGEVRDVEETCTLVATPRPPPSGEEALRKLAAEEARVEDELATVAALAKAYEKLRPSEPGDDPPEALPDARAWIAAHAFAEGKLRALDERRARLLREQKRLARERALLERTNEGDEEPPRFTRGVRFRLLAETAADIEIEYFVSAARWAPTYTLHLDDGRARLQLSALVAQASGEDWRSARLSFSTADLARETTLPELPSWRIGRAQPPRRPAFRPLPGDLEELFAGYDRDVRPAPPPSPKKRARVGSVRRAEPPPPPPSPPPMPMPMSAPAPATTEAAFALDESELPFDDFPTLSMSAAAPPPAMRAKRASAGGAPDALDEVQLAAPEPLPPRLRHAYLRLQGPDEPHRGTLRAVDPLRHLWDLVEDHEAASYEDLERAVEALRVAARQVESLPPPKGTTFVSADSFLHVYPARGEHDVPSDGSYHRVLAFEREASAEIDFRAVPRESTDVYRYCTLSAPEGTPLLPGPLHVHEDGAFRVTSRVDGSGGGARLELNLGVESALRVLGRTATLEQQEKGLVSSRSRVTHEVSVPLRSALSRPAKLVLYERLPVPDDNEDDIEVTLEESTPTPVRDDRDPRGHPLEGGMRFELTLAPGERAEVRYRYVISLPAKAEVVGGNRRE